MKAREGVNILDFTHVQSRPTCADVIKVECPGVAYAPATKNQTMYK